MYPQLTADKPAETKSRRVIIVDDHDQFRESLNFLLRAHGYSVSAYASGEAFLAHWMDSGPCCVILDLQLGSVSGLDVLRILRNSGHQTSVLIVTGTGTVPSVVEAFHLGVVDFLEKPYSVERLLESVQITLRRDHERCLFESTRTSVLKQFGKLSRRERDVMELLVLGKRNKEVASALNIAPKTVEHHRASLMSKLGISSIAELVRIYRDAANLPPRFPE
jgi:FixJ family two-component response regulator